jgi:uncharacterized protein (TIGR03437 family)
VAGSLVYATAAQVGAVVPYGVSGSSVQVVAQGPGATSAPVAAALAATAPGVFTLDGSGRGQAAAVNQDGRPNGDAAPAAAGSVITLLATGEGQTTTGGGPVPKPVASVAVRIGGAAADVQFAGGTPGGTAGVMQVNVVVPFGISGTVPVVITVGGVASQSGVTVVVK